MKRTIPRPTPIGLIVVAIFLSLQIAGRLVPKPRPEILIPFEGEVLAVESHFPSPTPTPKAVTPEEIIKEVFGKHTDKAMKLLTDDRCHENRGLDPLAVNDNREWGGVGRDRGIFQINDFYHPSVSDSCAFDARCNIEYAWRMYKNDNFTFRRWTCGKVLGI